MRGMTSLVDRLERELFAAASARPRDSARYAAVLERAVQTCSADPQVAEVLDLADLFFELATEYEALGRWEDALAAADAALDAGLQSSPDPRCLRAEILMRAGRVAEAEPIWAAVLADGPDDVWLYNNAGLEYAHAGDHEAALGWLTDGLRLALRTADPERLVDQLADLRQESLDSLGRPADALQEQAAGFLRDKQLARPASPWVEEPAPEPTDDSTPGPVHTVALAWLPAGDYEQAVQLWPELAASELVAGPAGPLPHRLYCHAMQQRLVELSQVGLRGLAIAPVRVAPFTAWCAEHGQQPDSEARATYAAHLAANAEPGVVSWPPGRNRPCWCGSGRKYKKCCAAPSLVDAEPQR
jgi:tetratricopeptide (TPR) repeat protein